MQRRGFLALGGSGLAWAARGGRQPAESVRLRGGSTAGRQRRL